MDKRVLKCEEAIQLLAEYLDEELEAGRIRELEHHLDICRSCYSRHEFEKGLKARISDLRTEPVGARFHERIRTLVGRFTDASRVENCADSNQPEPEL